MTDKLSDEQRTLVPMPIGSQDCQHCAGTGGPSPWEYDHHIWLKGEPHAVCGACKGAGMLSRFGRRISAAKVWNAHRYMAECLTTKGTNQ